MGRDIAGIRMDKKSDVVSPKGTPHGGADVAPPENDGTKEPELEKQIENGTHHQDHEPVEKIIKADTSKSTNNKSNLPVKTESDVNGLSDDHDGENNDLLSPSSAEKSRKQVMHANKDYYDDEDNCSLASSSARTSKFKVTVPIAPRFVVDERLERRKEFYSKLEEKHKALDKERHEHEARIKEEEEALIKQLRKTMVYKANPVPSFYKEGPPPKVELRKLPLTRPKSPNLTRRKSCSDATRSSPDMYGRAPRHSLGSYRDGRNSTTTPKTKGQTGVRKSNGTVKSKECAQKSKEIDESPPSVKETNKSHGVEEQEVIITDVSATES